MQDGAAASMTHRYSLPQIVEEILEENHFVVLLGSFPGFHWCHHQDALAAYGATHSTSTLVCGVLTPWASVSHQ